jgi:hypothetical protein
MAIITKKGRRILFMVQEKYIDEEKIIGIDVVYCEAFCNLQHPSYFQNINHSTPAYILTTHE